MSDSIINRRHLDFLVFEWLQAANLVDRPRYAEHSVDTFTATLDTAQAIATDLFAPHNRKADENEPQFDGQRVSMIPEVKTALQAYCDAGLLAASHDVEVGGMQLPSLISQACGSLFKSAIT